MWSLALWFLLNSSSCCSKLDWLITASEPTSHQFLFISQSETSCAPQSGFLMCFLFPFNRTKETVTPPLLLFQISLGLHIVLVPNICLFFFLPSLWVRLPRVTVSSSYLTQFCTAKCRGAGAVLLPKLSHIQSSGQQLCPSLTKTERRKSLAKNLAL